MGMQLPGGARTFGAWLRRPVSDTASAAYLVAVAAALTAWIVWIGARDAGEVGLDPFVTCAARIALTIGCAAALLGYATGGRVSRGVALVFVSSAVVAWLAADRCHVVAFGAHLDAHRLASLVDAVRTHALPFDWGLFAALSGVVALMAVGFRALLASLAALAPRDPPSARAVLVALAAAAGLAAVGPTNPALLAALPWGPREAPRESHAPAVRDAASDPFGSALEDRAFARLQSSRAAVLARPLAVAKRPPIVIVHVESARYDMLRDDVMPNTLRLSKACITTAHHYSTSNDTGSSMFGLLTGLPASYYAMARRDAARPLPLELLKKLGYSLSAYYSSFLSSYDGLCDLHFRGLVDHVHDQTSSHAEAADAALIDGYVAEIAARDPGAPTFDYVVLESSHYDYAYPPGFERFTPTASLGLGIRDGLVRPGTGVGDELRPQAAAVRNRYQNSLVYVDTLVGKIAAAWAARSPDVLLVVTGDHGEAFWEHGTFGHGLSLADEQVRVPLVVCVPGATQTRYAYSSHEDVFATIFDAMGLDAGPEPLVAGKSLLRYDPARDVAVLGYGLTGDEADDRLAVVGDGLKVVFVNRPPFATVSVARDGDVEVTPPVPADVSARAETLKARSVEARMLRAVVP
jgi:membrane-anchored protein YejM (alkaline phosphatase superfamily)